MSQDGPVEEKKRGVWSLLRGSFLQGLAIVIPVMVTYWILRLFYRAIDGTVTPALEQVLEFQIPGLGFIVALVVILLVGLVSRVVIGRQLLRWLERIITSIPLVRTIYSGSRDLINAFSLGRKGKTFQKVLLLEYPRRGLFTVGFVTNEIGITSSGASREVVYNVYIPNPPNPTSGVLLLVPKRDAVEILVSVEEALKLVLSGGIVSPDTLKVSRNLAPTPL